MKRVSIILALFTLIMISGCGFAPKGKGPLFSITPQVPGAAKVYHYRLQRTVGNGGYYKLYMNEKFVTGIGNGGYFEQNIMPGKYDFAIESESRMFSIAAAIGNSMDIIEHQFTLNAEPDKTYYYRWNVTDWDHRFEEVEEKIALEEMRGLKMFELIESD